MPIPWEVNKQRLEETQPQQQWLTALDLHLLHPRPLAGHREISCWYQGSLISNCRFRAQFLPSCGPIEPQEEYLQAWSSACLQHFWAASIKRQAAFVLGIQCNWSINQVSFSAAGSYYPILCDGDGQNDQCYSEIFALISWLSSDTLQTNRWFDLAHVHVHNL